MRGVKKKELFVNILLLIVVFLVFLIFAEIIARIFVEKHPVSDPGLYRVSNNSLIAFELTPGYKGLFFGQNTSISSAGLRDKEYTIEKQGFRIAVLGDSITFGYGVGQDETYANVLEKRLGKGFEVMNFGVSGYNTIQEAEQLRTKVLDYSPDLIVIGFLYNDAIETGGFVENTIYGKKDDIFFVIRMIDFITSRSMFVGYLKFKLRNIKFFTSLYTSLGYTDNRMSWYEEGTENYMNFKAALKKIGDITRQNNLSVIFLINPFLTNLDDSYPFFELDKKVTKLAEDEGFIVVNLFDFVKGVNHGDLKIDSMYDRHPGVVYHNITANVLFDIIKENPS